MDKLKDKLQKIVNDRNGYQKIFIPLGNPRKATGRATGLPRKENKPDSSFKEKRAEALYNDMICKGEEREKILLLECQELRSCLISIFKRIRHLQFQVSMITISSTRRMPILTMRRKLLNSWFHSQRSVKALKQT